MTSQQYILKNPFHPLDLSPSDLLTVYKRFDQLSQVNRNPKQQLSIDSISQLIASLKGVRPSEIQKCMTEALIKNTISWNQFLTFLDQQSEARSKILDWIMHEKNIIKYEYSNTLPIRQKIQKHYETISYLKVIDFMGQTLLITMYDNKKLFLTQLNNKLTQISKYLKINNKPHLQINISTEQSKFMEKSGCALRHTVKARKGSHCLSKTSKIDQQTQPTQSYYKPAQDDDEYFHKQRKNINSLFTLFKALPLQYSARVARVASKRISERNLTPANVNSIKQAYSDIQVQKLAHKTIKQIQKLTKPLQQAQKKLKSLYRQKAKLSYNPYSRNKSIKDESNLSNLYTTQKKAITFQRKQKQYLQQSIHQYWCNQLKCLVVIYYNLDIVLLKVNKDYNKVVLEEQDSTKLIGDKDNKKNQTVQCIRLYHHSIVDKWYVLVLIRTQFKTQYRNQYLSLVKGYELNLIESRRKNDFNYSFKSKKQTFVLNIGKVQIIGMELQYGFGLHFISHENRYIAFKQQCSMSYQEIQPPLFKYSHQQKFNNHSLTCLTISERLNKIVFGTISGDIIIYDKFSRQYSIKKLSNNNISELIINEENKLVYCLSNQKIHIIQLDMKQQLQILNVKNQQKLHEKVFHFDLLAGNLYCYGTEAKVYSNYDDQNILHQTRKVSNMYMWRLNKLKAPIKQIPQFQYKPEHISQMIITSENYFIMITDILEVVIVEREPLKVKLTLILDIPYDSKVMKMVLSEDQKLLCLLLFDQTIYIFNIYTQELYHQVKSSVHMKFTTISFLDSKNQYLIATGTQTGNLLLLPFPNNMEKKIKTLKYHTNVVSLIVVKGKYMISASQDTSIAIWQLPFNILKHEFKPNKSNNFLYQYVALSKKSQTTYLRSINGEIFSINLMQGKITDRIQQSSKWSACAFDICTNQLIGISKQNSLVFTTLKDSKWQQTFRVNIQSKQKILGIGLIQSEKVIIFFEGGQAVVWDYQKAKFSKPIKFQS